MNTSPLNMLRSPPNRPIKYNHGIKDTRIITELANNQDYSDTTPNPRQSTNTKISVLILHLH